MSGVGLLSSLCLTLTGSQLVLILLVRGEEAAPLPGPNMRLHLTRFFLGICRNLKSIVVQIGIADYFKEPSSPEAQKLFEDMVTKLQVRNWL